MKRLYRSTTDRKIAGVCGGIAEYLNIDSTIIRVIFIILLLPGGLPGLIPYLILWLVMPEAQKAGATPKGKVIDVDPVADKNKPDSK